MDASDEVLSQLFPHQQEALLEKKLVSGHLTF
jgi:hypothetical protein